jgi:hypothetical protein
MYEEIEEVVATICESWINGQRKQAANQMLGADDYNEIVRGVAQSDLLSEQEKIDFFAYVLMHS